MDDILDEPPKEKLPCVAGKYVEHKADHGFVYQYECSECHKKFIDKAPEASIPILCHNCFVGIWRDEGVRRRITDRQRHKRNKKKSEDGD